MKKEERVILSILAYVFVIIPVILRKTVFKDKDDDFVDYHISQGINFWILIILGSVLFSILGGILPSILAVIVGFLEGLFEIAIIVLMAIGIINSVTGKMKELPFIGKLKLFDK